MPNIFIMSDGTGRTATQILDAALTQFDQLETEINVRPGIGSEAQILAVIAEAREAGGFIVHTVVSGKLREYIRRTGRLHSVETIDLMGPLLAQLSDKIADRPSEQAGLFYQLNKAYFQRIEAMEYAFRHDDGHRVHELGKADMVLVGVSRTFKTPLSMYLAFKGWLVANVPIVMGMALPPIIDTLPPERVFALNTNPRTLTQIRHSRHKHLGGITSDYVDMDMVKLELMHARQIFSDHPQWEMINVANKPIEEIAFEILGKLQGKTESGQRDG